ncbi:MAG: hypothetical protein N3A57_00725 [Negativicutes bacterium]|nr:hypothetical protein [Negativicutes bacterium]
MTQKNQGRTRIMILSAPFGSGHRQAARAIAEWWEGAVGGECRELDVFELLPAWLTRGLVNTYLTSLQIDQRLYRRLYRASNRSSGRGLAIRGLLNKFFAGQIARELDRYRPAAVVCTHATPLGGMVTLGRKGCFRGPVYSVVTDYTVHRWLIYRDPVTYFVGCEENARELVAAGAGQVTVSGIPLRRQFCRPAAFGPGGDEQAATAGRPVLRVLISGGGHGLLPLVDLVGALLAGGDGLKLTVVCGRADRLRDRLLRLFGREDRLTVLGLVEDMAALMGRADLMIGKAGGVSVSEALQMAVPMIVYAPLPGQEEGNCNWLLSHQLARRADSLSELVGMVAGLADDRADLRRWRTRLLQRPRCPGGAMIVEQLKEDLQLG